MPTVLLRLPRALREELGAPLGPVFQTVQPLLEGIEGPLIAVGDMVTYHLTTAGVEPAVSIVDLKTERSPVDEAVAAVVDDADLTVSNPAGTITAALADAIVEALEADRPMRVRVDGEEDLAVLPAVIAAPDGAAVVYGQPGEGMVRLMVDPTLRGRIRSFVDRMDGDPEAFLSRLEPDGASGVDPPG